VLSAIIILQKANFVATLQTLHHKRQIAHGHLRRPAKRVCASRGSRGRRAVFGVYPQELVL
jgi:hypothetical protein